MMLLIAAVAALTVAAPVVAADPSARDWYAHLHARVKARIAETTAGGDVDLCFVSSRYWGDGSAVVSVHAVRLARDREPTLLALRDDLRTDSGSELGIAFPGDRAMRPMLTPVPHPTLPTVPVNHRTIFGLPDGPIVPLVRDVGGARDAGDRAGGPAAEAVLRNPSKTITSTYRSVVTRADAGTSCHSATLVDGVAGRSYRIDLEIVRSPRTEPPTTAMLFAASRDSIDLLLSR
ncbi:MAG TPA: hypothetical protein VEL07_16110 [Planctomycetota bacterium]|nr:hypothetical protein [Planctomycetota bacterium]